MLLNVFLKPDCFIVLYTPAQKLTAKVNMQQKPFRLINIPFYMVNQIERIVNDTTALT